jgi:hypothetical protein
MAIDAAPLYGPVKNLAWLVGVVGGLIILYIIFKMVYQVKRTL